MFGIVGKIPYALIRYPFIEKKKNNLEISERKFMHRQMNRSSKKETIICFNRVRSVFVRVYVCAYMRLGACVCVHMCVCGRVRLFLSVHNRAYVYGCSSVLYYRSNTKEPRCICIYVFSAV